MSTEADRKDAYRRCWALLAKSMARDTDTPVEYPEVWAAMCSVRDTLKYASEMPFAEDTQKADK